MDQREAQEILRRAQEIESQQGVMLRSQADVEQFVSAAEEAGLSRDAVLQALRERLRMPAEAFEPGSLVFAESADGRFHVASLTSLDEHTAKIRFLNWGTEETVTLEHIRLPREGVGKALEAKLWTYALAAGIVGTGVGMFIMRIILR